MPASKPTLADVARAAGVSVPTVSKAISGRSDVAGATRERVLSAMNELGYLARGATGGSDPHGIVELAIGGIASMGMMEIVRGVEEAVFRSGRSLVVSITHHDGFSIDRWIDSVLAHKAVGVIVASARVSGGTDRLVAAGIPVIHLDAGSRNNPDDAQVGTTNWAGMRDATRHMVALGHTRIGFIGGEAHVQIAQDRLEGYVSALRQGGLPVIPELIVEGNFIFSGGEQGARRLLDLDDPPTAIVAASDLAAAGVYHVARERGLSIPEDLSVSGFDDTVLCEYLSPHLTSVRQPLAQMADHAVRMLDEVTQNPSGPPPRLELSTTLIERGSTAAPGHR
ncbi:LacI family transcriptional regulator [Microbacterium nanhaiense]|uniref:LacI family transcriptional regulator n=1 Tax=Microbacterium nanhaiense TaxID=1301026 RepID=A0ABQ2N720_9MICO|nr:LacI family DNA-binding transcriptional regulator [Microbacterium nanhaiense]GGO65437.1 LacI family transcriptional regulator [Microbacterium nanhaiense]